MIAIGIDTGGTCTDAVAFDFDKKSIVATAKSATTHENLEIGIENSLNKLPEEYVEKAELLSLSTTLATNACVEDKGGRVLMIFICAYKKAITDNSYSYGFKDNDFWFVNCEEDRYEEPDWDQFEQCALERTKGYDSIAIADMNSSKNNGEYEIKAAKRLGKVCKLPIVCSYELFQDRNVIQRGASALLNAKLLPVIDDFLKAVKAVLQRKKLNIPIVIMRSDGTLMSEEYAKEHPVETLLCGPAASVKGGAYLGAERKALIVDMGGTTSDIAVVKQGGPVYAENGIRVGGWRTNVKGLFVDTFGLGGDSEVFFNDGDIELLSTRVVPLCVMADRFPETALNVKKAVEEHENGHTKALYTHYMLVKPIADEEAFDEKELALCRELEKGPLSIEAVAELFNTDIYGLNTSRLEKEGYIIRSGLTPTDMMCIKGDFDLYDSETSVLGTKLIADRLKKTVEEIADIVYKLVIKKLYENLVRISLEDRFGKKKLYSYSKEVRMLVEENYRISAEGADENDIVNPIFSTDAVLVGIGAPIHVFLPEVARLMGTNFNIPKEAGVTNALGALIGEVRATANVEISVLYEMDSEKGTESGYYVYANEKPEGFEELEDAVEYAKEQALRKAELLARKRGAKVIKSAKTVDSHKKSTSYGMDIYIGSVISAEVIGGLGDF